MNASRTWVLLCAVVAGLVSAASAVTIDWVPVGDPGNAPDTRYSTPGYGGVAYTYNIGKYEVTNTQYCEFLNAVADADPNSLYNTYMGSPAYPWYGGITRSGSSPNFTYSLISGRGNKPVNYVSWYDTLRFANWMHNGQPTGAQGSSTTENGAYDMSLGASVVRKPGAKVFLTSEGEWYKAAYYKGGGTNAGYWDYPTQSNIPPTAETPPGTNTTNGSANYNKVVGDLTNVGAYISKPSDSAYDTFDQGGNVFEWNEALIASSRRGCLGGSFVLDDSYLHASRRSNEYPTGEGSSLGFRVAEVPEPASIVMLALASVGVLRRKRA